jgi:uncharacterized membrane protein (UPF0127 family)
MNKKLLGIVIAILLIIAGIFRIKVAFKRPQSPEHYQHNITVGTQTLHIDIATSTQDMAQGLSDRLNMGDDQGMLFDFKSSQLPTFWMKDMNFPLDFLWISQGKIISITSNAAAAPKNSDGSFDDSHLPLYTPPSAIDEVLEVNAGWAQKNNIIVGDVVK